MPDGEDEAYYKPVMGRALTFDMPPDLLTKTCEITIPNEGTYPVTGGNITMEKFQIGTEGRDRWDGQIAVTVQTSQGPVSVTGTFSFCVVPVW